MNGKRKIMLKKKKSNKNRKIRYSFFIKQHKSFLIIFRIRLTLERKHIKPLKLHLRELNKNNVTYN